MSGVNWKSVFCLPSDALVGERRIPKVVMVRQASLTKTEQKVLDKVAAIRHFATVQKSTTRILPTVDAERDIQSIVFLVCEMAGSSAYAEVAGLIHKCFPNPTVLLLEGEGEVCVSVSITRKSLAERGAVVVDEVQASGAFEFDGSLVESFLASLAFDGLPQSDLFAYVGALAWNVRVFRAAESLGFYPQCNEADRNLLESLLTNWDELEKQASDLRKRWRNPGLSLNESAGLRIELKRCEKELAQVGSEIREICYE